MKLQTISESTKPDVTIYHVANLWPGSFIEIGAISPKDATDLGFHAGKLTGDEPDDGQFMGGVVSAMKKPHPIIVDEILELSDEEWVKALMFQSKLLAPNMVYNGLRIIDRNFDGYNMMTLSYIANVNLELFMQSMDWSLNDIQKVDGTQYFKIIKQL